MAKRQAQKRNTAVSEVTIANKYIGLLRDQAATGYDYAKSVMGVSKAWFLGLFLSGIVFIVFYFSSYASSIWGAHAASDMLKNASKEEVATMTRKIDPELSKADVVFDFKRGVLSSTEFNDGAEGLWNNLYNYFTTRDGDVSEPGSVKQYVVVSPDGTEYVAKETKQLPKITMSMDYIIGERECNLTKEEAGTYLCERGITNNRRARKALNTSRYCQREMHDAEGCTLWTLCTKQILLDHYSAPVTGAIVDSSTAALGGGKMVSIPRDLCQYPTE